MPTLLSWALAISVTLLAASPVAAQSNRPAAADEDEPPVHLRTICAPSRYDDAYHGAIVTACAALTRSHGSPTLGQTIVIDLATSDLQPSVLPGKFITSLLLQPNVVPESAVGGLRIQGGTIQGTIKLVNATIDFPVSFRYMTFSTANKASNGLAIDAAFSHFLGDFAIEYSSFPASSILIDQSTFDGNLFIKRSKVRAAEQHAITLTESRVLGDVEIFKNTIEAPRGVAINVVANMVRGNAIITQNEVRGSADVFNNEGRLMEISGTFDHGVKVLTNDVRDLKVFPHGVSRLPVIIDGNIVKTDLQLTLEAGLRQSEDGPNYLSVSDNSVSGSLRLLNEASDGEPDSEPTPLTVDSTDIVGNFVGGDMRLFVPEWLKPASDVVLNVSANQVNDETVIYHKRCNGLSRNGFINLSSTDTQRFAWSIPSDCEVGWTANGFGFDEWIPKSEFAQSIEGGSDTGVLVKAWAELQGEHANPEMLRAISAYLIGRGYNEEGRDMLETANESTYAVTWRGNLPETLLDIVTYLYLLPTGYGAKPERALVILFVVWVIGVAVYEAYVWGCKRAAANRPVLSSWVRWPDHEDAGSSEVPGFSQYDEQKKPKNFSVVAFATDAALPFINLHAYSAFYPDHWVPRTFSFVQHFFGWWMLTSFLASAAVLGA